ncbi:hypothetical protein [Treponema succinifaciens]|uniref:Uncharacterized protein n=1 Tax=Treponema succinifaciens (strain ATCC 33096 / DSM 2489 / 6091) TaxID=869209 RepID=F2NXE6_TRES6|nr:hypothetical protein [Treponema succinifaciens]AEB14025.1 hypothetical protein Tresu_1111 [Treponema succinifaciens DSM 2489]MCI6913797.1 hypothetical protein [Treponema succinifaciens]MCR5606955.1 hypothetical protein [Treponema sp.]
MINSLQTSNGISHLAKQTTDMAPITIDTTVVPTALSNIVRSDIVYVENLIIDTQPQPILPVENMVIQQSIML